MKAVRYSEYGEPEVLKVDDVEEPHAGAGQVRIAVRAAGVNPNDWKQRTGMMAKDPLAHPVIPGLDAAGVVDEVGDGVTGVSAGDDVFGSAVGGATAEHAVLSQWARKPEGMSFEEAAGLPVAVETAERGLKLLGVGEGDTLLVNGAAGGVGLAVVQFARARGARVVGTASERNHEFLRTLGVEPVTYGDGLVERVRELLPDGVDAAYDTFGGGESRDLIELTGDPQRVVSIADFGSGDLGIKLTSGSEGRSWEALDRAAELFGEGRFSLPVAQSFPFSQAPEAHRASQDGHVRGKLVLVPD
ncbi:MAG: hypothetical protein QOE28_625 [Solirubrobacteraceae bacterium]|nr:hypothetical protein [Solirubrobacteraceae bacterium]